MSGRLVAGESNDGRIVGVVGYARVGGVIGGNTSGDAVEGSVTVCFGKTECLGVSTCLGVTTCLGVGGAALDINGEIGVNFRR